MASILTRHASGIDREPRAASASARCKAARDEGGGVAVLTRNRTGIADEEDGHDAEQWHGANHGTEPDDDHTHGLRLCLADPEYVARLPRA